MASVRKPTIDELRHVNKRFALRINENEFPVYEEIAAACFDSFSVLNDFAEPQLPVLYPRTCGRPPSREENKYNAWAWLTDIKGAAEGKLRGMRLAVKDSIPVAGVPMRCGSRILDGYTPDFDATIVTRILSAGGTIIGKTTCEDLCYSPMSNTSASGPVLNPHDCTRSSGGSSSGSAAVLAAGEVPLALGGDQGGSIRMPACWSGVVGHKPTYGLVPFTGCMSMEATMDHVGPMARTVYDCALLLEVIAGYDNGLDDRQPVNLTVPCYTSLLTGQLDGIRVGIVREGFVNCESDVAAMVDGRARSLASRGATVVDISIPHHLKGYDIWSVIDCTGCYQVMMINSGVSVGTKHFVPSSLVAAIHAGTKAHLHAISRNPKALVLVGEYINENFGAVPYIRGQNLARVLRQAYDDALKTVDVLIMPTIKFKAPKLQSASSGAVTEGMDEHCNNPLFNTAPFDITGHPAISVNAGFSTDRLPIGLMVIGRHFEDSTVLNVAFAVEKLVAS